MNNFITQVDILDESKECFLTYAEEVLTDRAIPTAEDGLLSSQRKILWTMEDHLGMDSKGKTKKCNAIVGSTLATSYFHGDASCYGVLCKMSQEYLMRYPLIKGQGSLGTQENNDMVASSRYTEAKPSIYTDLMMNNFAKKVVPEKETYNGEYMEPVMLPGLFPNALCNGRQAIGISMAHNSLPQNLTEVCNGIIHYIKKGGNLSLDELMKDIQGPDFPLGGTVINAKDIRTAYLTGKSGTSLKVRGDYEIDGKQIIFTSIPYRTYRNKIKEQINNNIDEFDQLLEDFNDESSVGQNRLVFTVKNESSLLPTLNKLFALTDLQTTLSYNMNFIVNGTPKLCSLLDLVSYYVKHQENVLLKATEFDREKAAKRLHILNGLIVAIDKIDEAINLIKASENKAAAREGLMKLLNVDDVQANAILDMKLAKLTRIDKNELIQEKSEKEAFIYECDRIINDKEHRDSILIDMITKLRDKYGDARRTKLENITIAKKEKEIQYVEPEKCVVVMTEAGTIKRIPTSSFRAQKRNGKGVKTQEDITSMVLRTNTVDSLMIFSDKGVMYRLLVNDIPVGTNTSKGAPIKSLVPMEPDEKPATMYSIYRDTEAKYVMFVTKNGIVKKTTIDEYTGTKKKNGVGAIKLREGDSLAAVTILKDEPMLLVTANGYAIKFDSMEIGSTSRMTVGIKGINLSEDDEVVAALPIRNPNDAVAIFSEKGLGKKVLPADIVSQKRGGKGLMFYKPTAETGPVRAAAMVSDEDSLLLIGDRSSICIAATDIPALGRTSIGNQMIKNGKVIAVSKV